MALFEERGFEAREVRTSEGEARLWRLGPLLYVSSVSGRMGQPHADLFVNYAERLLEEHSSGFYVFHDWLDMTGYESRCRKELTDWSVRHRDSFEQVHIGLRSKIVAMGVQVANIALRNFIQVHPNRAALQSALREHMHSEGIVTPSMMPPSESR